MRNRLEHAAKNFRKTIKTDFNGKHPMNIKVAVTEQVPYSGSDVGYENDNGLNNKLRNICGAIQRTLKRKQDKK